VSLVISARVLDLAQRHQRPEQVAGPDRVRRQSCERRAGVAEWVMSKTRRPKSNSEAKQRRAKIARKRWRKQTLAAMKAGDTDLIGVDRMLADELSQARHSARSASPPTAVSRP
jgi:hypothetical protein